MTYVVAVFLNDRAYGGPEEGGWWYTTSDLVRTIRRFKSEALAIAYSDRMQRLLDRTLNKGRRPISSALSTGRYNAGVSDGEPPQHTPFTTPHYE